MQVGGLEKAEGILVGQTGAGGDALHHVTDGGVVEMRF
jgi:hypothetical protein